MILSAVLFDYQLPADVRVYEFVLAGIFVFAGLFKVQVKNFEFNGSWIVRTLSVLVGICLFYLAGTGKSLATEPNPEATPVSDVSNAGAGDPCVLAGLEGNPQCYFSLGHAWNDLDRFDRATALFALADTALKKEQDQNVWWKTRAFLYRDWGYALGGQGKCQDAIKKFDVAKKLFDDNHYDDGGGTKDGIAKAQSCKF